MEPGGVGDRLQPGGQVAVQTVEQARSATGINGVATTDMLVQFAIGDELGQRPLGERRRMPVADLLGPDHGVDERAWQHRIAQAHLRKGGLGKRANEGHQAILVHALQAIGGPALEAELAVVVVFDDNRAQCLGTSQQSLSARGGHRHAQGILVRRGHVDQPGVVGNEVDADALVVNRYTDHGGTQG
ncbi:hypothetical protein D3C85_1117410 [compost metagenome]